MMSNPRLWLPSLQLRFHSSRRLVVLLTSLLGLFALLASTCLTAHAATVPSQSIVPGGSWTDSSGNSIQAHGSGLIKVGSTYYWFGENRASNSSAFVAISCYSST